MNIQSPALIPSLNIGGRTFTDLRNLKFLVGGVSGAANGNTSFREGTSTTGYAPPASKVFRVLAARSLVIATGTEWCSILYADNDVGFSTNTAFTNAKHSGGAAGVSSICLPSVISSAWIETPYDFIIPTGKFLSVTNFASASTVRFQIFGYEE